MVLKGRELAIQIIKNLKMQGYEKEIPAMKLASEVSKMTGSIDKGFMTRFMKSMVSVGLIRPTSQGFFEILWEGE